MARRGKLTNNSEEADISALLSGDAIFSIPYFQRPYKWKPARLRQFESDVLDLVDDESITHFLGAIIIHGRRSSPSDPTLYEVIDGQQRITTLYLYLAAGIRTLADLDRVDDATAFFQKYLAIGRSVKAESNFKLHPCKEDRRQINRVIDDLLKNAELAVQIGSFRPAKLSDTGWTTGTLSKNYDAARSFFRHHARMFGVDQVIAILNAMLERMSVVQIDVLDPTNGPKIFDSLNSRQEPMTVGDLVRNEIFSRVATLGPEKIDYVDSHAWQPFYAKFKIGENKSLFELYFFPYGLIQNPNLNKSEVYAYLRNEWVKHSEPADIIAELAEYQDSFLDLMSGSNLQALPKQAAKAVRHFYDFGFPASALPFLMQLTKGIADGSVDLSVGVDVLATVESFLVRRALCGIEPTGLHAVFRRLWNDVRPELSAAEVRDKIMEKTTVTWPDDEMVIRAVKTRPLYGSSIAQYVIAQYDQSLGGDVPANIPWIEHVLPQAPDASWDTVFDAQQRLRMTHLWANLLPLSSKMNSDLRNSGYEKKRSVFMEDAMFKSTRSFAKEFETWAPDNLEARSDELAAWAVQRWTS